MKSPDRLAKTFTTAHPPIEIAIEPRTHDGAILLPGLSRRGPFKPTNVELSKRWRYSNGESKGVGDDCCSLHCPKDGTAPNLANVLTRQGFCQLASVLDTFLGKAMRKISIGENPRNVRFAFTVSSKVQNHGLFADYAFSSPRRPSARSSAGCIFMSRNSAMAKSRCSMAASCSSG
jgi:hypothetical protein